MDATTTTNTTPTSDASTGRTTPRWRLTAARYVAGAGLGLLALVSGTAAMDAAAAGTPTSASETVLVRTVAQSTPASSDPSMAASRSAWS